MKVLDGETLDEILVVGICHRRCPLEIWGIDIRRLQQQLEALVGHRADGVELTGEARARRQRAEEEKIRDQPIIVSRLGGYPAAEESGVGTKLPFPSALVAEIGVAEGDVIDETGASGERKLCECDELRVGVQNARLTSCPAKRAAQAEIVERSSAVVHEYVRRRQFRECLPPLRRGEGRRCVPAHPAAKKELVSEGELVLSVKTQRTQLDVGLRCGKNGASADEIANRSETVGGRLGDAHTLRRIVRAGRGPHLGGPQRSPVVARYRVLVDDAIVLENGLRASGRQRGGAEHGVARHELALLEAGVVDADGVIDEEFAERSPAQLRRSNEPLDRLRIANAGDRQQWICSESRRQGVNAVDRAEIDVGRREEQRAHDAVVVLLTEGLQLIVGGDVVRRHVGDERRRKLLLQVHARAGAP